MFFAMSVGASPQDAFTRAVRDAVRWEELEAARTVGSFTLLQRQPVALPEAMLLAQQALRRMPLEARTAVCLPVRSEPRSWLFLGRAA